MGWGDDIMSTAWARRAKQKDPDALVFLGAEGKRIEWTEVFEGNPNIAHPKQLKALKPKVFVPHYTGNRPYIKGTSEDGRIIYASDHRTEKGDIFLQPAEIEWARQELVRAIGRHDGFILIEPHVKGTFAGNKAWLWDRWREVAEKVQAPIIQTGSINRPLLPKAQLIETKTIRQAFAVLSLAACVVVTDGALHHAAAALDVPAVVLWGARTNPLILGYPDQSNLWTGQGDGCGAMLECKHCIDGMNAITVDMVLSAIEGILD